MCDKNDFDGRRTRKMAIWTATLMLGAAGIVGCVPTPSGSSQDPVPDPICVNARSNGPMPTCTPWRSVTPPTPNDPHCDYPLCRGKYEEPPTHPVRGHIL